MNSIPGSIPAYHVNGWNRFHSLNDRLPAKPVGSGRSFTSISVNPIVSTGPILALEVDQQGIERWRLAPGAAVACVRQTVFAIHEEAIQVVHAICG